MITFAEIEQHLAANYSEQLDETARRAVALRVPILHGDTVEAAIERYSAKLGGEVDAFIEREFEEADRAEVKQKIAADVLAGVPIAEAATARVGWTPRRVEVVVSENEARVVSETLNAIERRGARIGSRVYQRGGKLVEARKVELPFDGDPVERDPSTRVIVEVSRSRARALAAENCGFCKYGDKKRQDLHVPEWLPGSMLAASTWPFAVLAGLAEAPTMRPDGTLITRRGYDVETGIYLTEDVGISVPESPTLDDARRATARLLDVVCDFDFSTEAGRSVWLSALLSVVARPAIDGPVPLHVFDASTAGAGKSKLADAVSIIATGRSAAKIVNCHDDQEWNKTIVSLGMAGDSLVLIDNVSGELGGQCLDMALTTTLYRSRLLGSNSMTPPMPMRIVWLATGNGITIRGDLDRRFVLARLEPQCERPEEREGPRPGAKWKYPRFDRYVADHRAELLSDALTIVRAYVVAGRPAQKVRPMDYTAWTDLVRGAIVWVGEADPGETVVAARAADPRKLAFHNIVACWPIADGIAATVGELLEWANVTGPLMATAEQRSAFAADKAKREAWRTALIEWCPPKRGDKGDLPTPQALGRALRSVNGAVVGAHKIEGGKHGERGVPWRRVRIDGSVLRAVA